MSFAFFYPLAWLGALAVAAPIWLHLRRRKDPNLVRFSAMRFLDDQPAARSRPLWPHDWPLLLLRLLALLLLVAAFSWPYLQDPEEVLIRESRVYILDNTLSHQAAGGFEKARREILHELSDAGLERQIAVVELSALPRVVVGFGDPQDEAAEKLRKLKPSFQRGSYLSAFRVADRLLRNSLGQHKRIVLLGDSQENQWTEEGHVPPFLEDVEVTVPEVAPESRPNLALMEPHLRRIFSGPRPTVECVVRLHHQGDLQAATLVFRANGEDVLRRRIQPNKQPEPLTLLAQWESDPGQWVRGEVRLEGEPDDLPGDDRVAFSLPPVREGRVALWSRSPFLRTALSPDVMRGRWKTHTPTASDLARENRGDSDHDVLCVESRFLESSEVRQLVLDCLDRGKGVVLLIDRVTPASAGVLRELGIETLSESPPGAAAGGCRYVFMEHWIFQPFRSADFGELTEITVRRYRRLKMPGAMPLIFSDAGDPLLFESASRKGRLLVLAFSLDRAETNWPLHPTFIPFLDRCLGRARSEATIQTEFRPGEACVWKVPAGREATEVVLKPARRADGGRPVRAAVEDGQARFLIPNEPGLYALSYDEHPGPEGLLAVNPPPKESELSYTRSPETLEAWKHQNAAHETTRHSAASALELSKVEILRQHVWWWLVLGGLTLLIAETAWVSMRKVRA